MLSTLLVTLEKVVVVASSSLHVKTQADVLVSGFDDSTRETFTDELRGRAVRLDVTMLAACQYMKQTESVDDCKPFKETLTETESYTLEGMVCVGTIHDNDVVDM